MRPAYLEGIRWDGYRPPPPSIDGEDDFTEFQERLGNGQDALLEFPFNLPPVRWLMEHGRLEFGPTVTFFVGENGSGKSTLLEAIADKLGFDEQGGSKHFSFHSDEPFTKIRSCIKLMKCGYPSDGYYVRAESYNLVTRRIEELRKEGGGNAYGPISLLERSHGESFLALLIHRLTGKGLYLFDEPEAALSVQTQFAALGFMNKLVQQRSQFIIATHSPILLAYPDAWIYRFSEDGIERISYEESDPYLLTRNFLENPQRMISRIFK